MTVFEHITAELERRGMTWPDLFSPLEITKQTVYHWRTRSIPPKRYPDIAAVLHTTVDWVVSGSGRAPGAGDMSAAAGESRPSYNVLPPVGQVSLKEALNILADALEQASPVAALQAQPLLAALATGSHERRPLIRALATLLGEPDAAGSWEETAREAAQRFTQPELARTLADFISTVDDAHRIKQAQRKAQKTPHSL